MVAEALSLPCGLDASLLLYYARDNAIMALGVKLSRLESHIWL